MNASPDVIPGGSGGPDSSAVDPGAALVAENQLLANVLRGADLTADVPTCPGWSLTQLMRHVGRGDRWAAAMVENRATEAFDPRQVPGGKPPQDAEGALAWLVDGVRQLRAAVAVDPSAEVWTFTGPKPAAWWVRRRLHEATVHRADAALALGLAFEIEPAVAADGVSEWLGLLAARTDAAILPAGATLHLHATDGGLGGAGEWAVHAGSTGITWDHGHLKADAAVRGTAADLLLGVMRRIPADDARLDVVGDRDRWTAWLANTSF